MSISSLSPMVNPSKEQLREREKELKKIEGKTYHNDNGVELQWAQKAYKHTQIYYKLICGINCTKLKLTKVDEELYQHFLVTFPRIKIDVIDEDKLKSVGSKRNWRSFIEMFEHHVEDFNFGTLLRLDCSKGYSETNTTLVPRVQFLAIEVARNRQGLNLVHFGKTDCPTTAPKLDDESLEQIKKVEDALGNMKVQSNES